jgi:hypothetical protein
VGNDAAAFMVRSCSVPIIAKTAGYLMARDWLNKRQRRARHQDALADPDGRQLSCPHRLVPLVPPAPLSIALSVGR